MKILAISYLYPNSAYPHYGIFVHNRLKAVSKYHEVKVINPIPWFPGYAKLERYRNYDQIPSKEVIDGIEVFHPRFLVIPKYFKFFDAITYRAVVLPLVQRLYSTYPFDLIDLHWTYPDLPAGVALKEKYGKKMLVTLRGREAFHIGEGRIRERLIRKNLLRADAVISLSKELQDMAIDVGVPENRCRVIRNGVDTNTFYYMDQAECRRKLGLNEKEKILLSVGGLIHRKGLDRIIKTLPQCTKYIETLRFMIIGEDGPEGSYKRKLKNLVARYDVKDNVCFCGKIDNNQLNLWYNAADIFVLASRGEGSPNVLTEALAAGCPSIATNVGAVPDILTSDEDGVICYDLRLLGDFIFKSLTRKYDRRAISARNRRFSWDWCAKKVLEVLNKFCL